MRAMTVFVPPTLQYLVDIFQSVQYAPDLISSHEPIAISR